MFTPAEIHDLPNVLSAPRFATYLRACANSTVDALNLYQWNLQISAAFIVPIQLCEVGARNGVAEAIAKVHGPNWPWSNGFIRSLPSARGPNQYSPGANLRTVASREPTTGKVVANLSFAFWEKILTVGQDQRIWTPHFMASFPGVAAGTPVAVARAAAFDGFRQVRAFRNRIAHHEPIFSRNLQQDYLRLREIIAWRSPTAATWLDKIEGVTALLAARP